jgi:L-fuculose-phosphate aldolase
MEDSLRGSGKNFTIRLIMASNDKRAYTSEPALIAMREKIAELGALLFQRHLTDVAGGNLSARVGDVVCMSPRFAGSKWKWLLQPEDVLIVDLDGNILVGSGQISRESGVHLRLHRDYGEHGTGVIHAHARNVLPFAAMARPIPPVLEGTRKFGEISIARYAPSHTPEIADCISEAIRGQEARIRKHAAATIGPWHGLFCIGKDIDATFDAVERIDTNAYIILMSAALGGSPNMTEQRAGLEAAIAPFETK